MSGQWRKIIVMMGSRCNDGCGDKGAHKERPYGMFPAVGATLVVALFAFK